MSNNKQSSIEFLVDKVTDLIHESHHPELADLYQQAKAMHHKEVVDFVEDWYCNGPLLGGGVDIVATIEEHYNKKFGGNK